MSDLVLAAINARHAHASHALRCLLANLGGLAPRTALVESTLQEAPAVVAERVLAHRPRLVGVSVAVWNRRASAELLDLLRQADPSLRLVAGGPEIVAGSRLDDLAPCDVLVCGEAEAAFPALAGDLLAGRPVPRLVEAPPPDLAALESPYPLYTDDDLRHRVVYVEATRGCPGRCVFCTSAGAPLRRFPDERLRPALAEVLARGARRLKFLDRSFDADPALAADLLTWLRPLLPAGSNVQIELRPRSLPDPLRRVLATFPPEALRVEVGVQSLHPPALAAVGRPVDPDTALTAVRDLVGLGAVVHADLIAGLPHETLTTFLAGFDALWSCHPAEVQAGLLKRLAGTALDRRAEEWGLRFSAHPPYVVTATPDLDFATLRRLDRLGHLVDLLANRGRFPRAVGRLTAGVAPGVAFLALADQVANLREHGLAIGRQALLLRASLLAQGQDATVVDETLAADFLTAGTVSGLPRELDEALRRLRHSAGRDKTGATTA